MDTAHKLGYRYATLLRLHDNGCLSKNVHRQRSVCRLRLGHQKPVLLPLLDYSRWSPVRRLATLRHADKDVYKSLFRCVIRSSFNFIWRLIIVVGTNISPPLDSFTSPSTHGFFRLRMTVISPIFPLLTAHCRSPLSQFDSCSLHLQRNDVLMKFYLSKSL